MGAKTVNLDSSALSKGENQRKKTQLKIKSETLSFSLFSTSPKKDKARKTCDGIHTISMN